MARVAAAVPAAPKIVWLLPILVSLSMTPPHHFT
jgi:hypothetical protein